MKDEVQRDAQFTVPPGSTQLLHRLPGFEDLTPLTEVLRMLRCGFGMRYAPRLWNKLLRKVLQELGLTALQSDPQLFVWHADDIPHRIECQSATRAAAGQKRRVLILSILVDDFKGAGEAEYRRRHPRSGEGVLDVDGEGGYA